MQSTLNKSIIRELEKVNPLLVEGIEGTETEKTLKAAHTILNLRITRKVQPKSEIIKSKKYRKDEAYILMELEKDATGKQRILDIRPVKTIETLLKIITDIGNIRTGNSISYLYTPNPVKISEDYWKAYKHTRDPYERKRLATEYQLLMDVSILNISYIVLDIDSPFEEVYPVWEELVKKLGITGYIVYKTKSGRFRAYIKVSGTYNNGEKVFKLTPYGIGRNKRKHIINAYEIQYILATYFEKRGLKYDHSFVGRLNHPVWLEETSVFGKGKSQLYEIIDGEIPFYTLYNRVKKLQKKEGLWTYKGENIRDLLKEKEEEFTQQTTGTKQTTGTQQTSQQTKQQTQQTAPKQTTTQQTTGNKQGTQKKIKKSKLKMTDEERLEEAIETLKGIYKTNRFTKIMLPVCGWAKYLNIPKDTVYDLLKKYIPTKKNFDEDFEKAWKYGDPLEFSYGLQSFIKGVETYLNEFINVSEKLRKDLRKRFSSEADYYEIERYLLSEGYIEAEYRKEGRGRPKKIIKLTQKGINLIQQWQAGNKLKDLLDQNNNNTGNTANTTNNNNNNNPSLGKKYFTLYNYIFYSPLGEQYIDIPSDKLITISLTNGLVDGWINKIDQGNPSISIYNPDNPLNPSNHLTLEPLNKTTNPLNPPILKTTHPVKNPPTFKPTHLLEPPTSKTNLPIKPPTSKNNDLPVKLTTFDLSIFDKLTTKKNHYVKFITFLLTDTFHLSKNSTHSDTDFYIPFTNFYKLSISNLDKLTKKTISTFDNLSETNSDLSTFDKQPKNLSNFDNISETNYDNSKTISTFETNYDKTNSDKTISNKTISDKQPSKSETIDPDKDKQPTKKQPKKSKDKGKNSISQSKNKEKSNSKKPKKNLSGGFTREARIMAIILGYEKDQMGRAIRNISECISYFYQKNQANLDDAIFKTFAVYIYLSQKSGWKKVFLPAAALPRFEDESLQSEISKAAWGLLERFKKKQKWQRERQEQKQKQKQKKIL